MKNRCMEIAIEIRDLLNELEDKMPKSDDTQLALNIAKYAMGSLCNRFYKEEMLIDWGVNMVLPR